MAAASPISVGQRALTRRANRSWRRSIDGPERAEGNRVCVLRLITVIFGAVIQPTQKQFDRAASRRLSRAPSTRRCLEIVSFPACRLPPRIFITESRGQNATDKGSERKIAVGSSKREGTLSKYLRSDERPSSSLFAPFVRCCLDDRDWPRVTIRSQAD